MPASPLSSPVTTEKPLKAEEPQGDGEEEGQGGGWEQDVGVRDPSFNFCSTAYPHCALGHTI